MPRSCAAASAVGDLPRDLGRARRRERPFARDDRRQRLALDELHREIERAVGRLAEVVDLPRRSDD